jgi:hypothetical protein
MLQEDPQMGSPSPIVRVDLNELGMEAQSILKSIRTEHAKLMQSPSIALSDLHYFRARHNYYRLSLVRLLTSERKMLEPVLGKFREAIFEVERRFEQGGSVLEPSKSVTPFLTPVQETSSYQPQISAPEVGQKSEPTRPVSEINSGAPNRSDENRPRKRSTEVSAEWVEKLQGDLELLELALEAPLDDQRKRSIIRGIQRARKSLDQI